MSELFIAVMVLIYCPVILKLLALIYLIVFLFSIITEGEDTNIVQDDNDDITYLY